MAQEFFIKSDGLESKVRQLLPSQGGLGAGFDLSASTQIIPIVDLTESAEGSDVRADLQTALSFSTSSSFNISNSTVTQISNTGYFRVFGIANLLASSGVTFSLVNGATTKIIASYVGIASQYASVPFDFNVFLSAGDSMTIQSSNVDSRVTGATRQIADIDGNLVNP